MIKPASTMPTKGALLIDPEPRGNVLKAGLGTEAGRDHAGVLEMELDALPTAGRDSAPFPRASTLGEVLHAHPAAKESRKNPDVHLTAG